MSFDYIEFSKYMQGASVDAVKKMFGDIKAYKVNIHDAGSMRRHFEAEVWIDKLNQPSSDGGTLRDARLWLQANLHTIPENVKALWAYIGGDE